MSGTQPVDEVIGCARPSSTPRSGEIRRAARRVRAGHRPRTRSSASPASARRCGRSSGASPSRLRTRRASSPPAISPQPRRQRGGGRLIPVDSEHSALFQCLEGVSPRDRRLARPDRVGRPVPRLVAATSSRRDHGTRWPIRPGRWGQRSHVDSATLANKGLELIEAHWLFGVRTTASRSSSTRRRSCTARPLPRRGGARACRVSGHARADLVRAHATPSAAPTPAAPLDLSAGLELRFEAS